jgi:hypothetical protein
MLAVGLATFVVSISLAASDGGSATPAPRPAANMQTPVARAVPPAAPIVVAPPPAAPPSVAEAPPEPTSVPEVQVSAPEDVSAGLEQQAAPDQPAPPEGVPPPATDVPLPASTVSPEKPPLLTRILSHIPGLHDDPQPAAPTTPPPAEPQPGTPPPSP